MKKIFQYHSEAERETILAENITWILIEEQNITDGNFLIFSDVPIEKEIVYINVPQQQFDSVNKQIETLSDTTDFLLGM